jgi:hypothetical protein
MQRHALVVLLVAGNDLPLDQVSVRKADNKLYVNAWSKNIALEAVNDLRRLSQQYK